MFNNIRLVYFQFVKLNGVYIMKFFMFLFLMFIGIRSTEIPQTNKDRDLVSRDTISRSIEFKAIDTFKVLDLNNKLKSRINLERYFKYSEKYRHTIQSLSDTLDIPIPFIHAVVSFESNWSSTAVSYGNCVGLTQTLNGSTNPEKNLYQGVFKLRTYSNILFNKKCYQSFSNLTEKQVKLLLDSYNRGIAGAKRYYKIKGTRTSPYSENVYALYQAFKRFENTRNYVNEFNQRLQDSLYREKTE